MLANSIWNPLKAPRALGFQPLGAAMAVALLSGTIFAQGKPGGDSPPRPCESKSKAIVERLRPDLATFALYLTYVPRVREERPNLELYAPLIVIHAGDERLHITDEQCRKIFDWLVADGFFDRARELVKEKGRQGLAVGPFYDLMISVGGQSPMYHASIGWDKNTIMRLKALRALLDGSPAKAVDRLVAGLSHDEIDAASGPAAASPKGALLTVAAEKDSCQIGDPIVLTFTIENISDKDILIYDGTDLYQSWFHEFVFHDESGKLIPFTSPEEDFKEAMTVARRLRPGEKARHKILLNGWKLAGLGHPYTSIGKESRKFVITGTYRTPAGFDFKQPEAWLGRIEAKPTAISVGP